MKRRAIAAALVFLLVGACAGPRAPTTASPTDSKQKDEHLEEIRSALLDPAALPHLMWRQKLVITAQGKTYHLEAVIQSDGEEFQVLALGPGGMKLFLVSQDSTKIDTQVFVPRTLALSPEFLLFDIQRALFWTSEAPCAKTKRSFEFRKFEVHDLCAGGRTLKRSVSDGPFGTEHFESKLTIEYEPAFDFEQAPTSLRLRHPRRGYQIDIEQLESHQLP